MQERIADQKSSSIAPAYAQLPLKELRRKAATAVSLLGECRICPRECGANRLENVSTDSPDAASGSGRTALCRTGRLARVASRHPHFGEEAPLVGRDGSGTIFFSHCNLRCIFCQNFDISRLGQGWEVEAGGLAGMMLELQAQGCHNINLVSPSHVVPQILEALVIAVERGLRLPLVYNSGGYDSLEALRLLDGIVDIYMPDAKYSDEGVALRLSGVRRYPQVNRAALKEMHRQVGDLTLDERGVAVRGLIVRHLVLPEGQAGTAEVARFVAEEISPNTYFNLMDQYRPAYRAHERAALSRRPTYEELQDARRAAHLAGLRHFAD